ncbi:MAG: CHRD domain-containing protein [Burkholderiales bacterium]|nr:CHRD domain-containing protein [Burkholderiales bacterium]
MHLSKFGNNVMDQGCRFVIMSLFFGMYGSSWAGALVSSCAGHDTRFAGVIIHGNINANANHNNYAVSCTDPMDMNKQKWKMTASFKETDKGLNNNDIFEITAGDVEHTVAPDAGELPGNKIPLPGIGVKDEVGKGGLKLPGALATDLNLEKKAHGNHEDRTAANLMYFIDPNLKDINGYQYTITGRHLDPNAKVMPGKGGLTSLPSGAFGSFSFMIDTSTGELDLALALSNLSMLDISLAQIREGTPLTPGATLLDLMPAFFEDLLGLGTSRLILGDLFPIAGMNSLLSGNTYVEIVTSAGTLTGQLALISEPPALALLAIGALGLFAFSGRSFFRQA